MSFKIVEDIVSGDFVFDAFGETLEEMLISCAEACFSATTDLSGVDAIDEFSIVVEGEDLNELLFNFLAELIYLKDTERIFLSKFELKLSDNNSTLKAVARGEKIDYDKHEIKTDVKAVTYHKLEVKQTDSGFTVRVMLDL